MCLSFPLILNHNDLNRRLNLRKLVLHNLKSCAPVETARSRADDRKSDRFPLAILDQFHRIANGITYRPVFDDENINALGDVEVAFSDPEIVYVGTGNLSYWGEGMYKSTDGGQSWTHIGLKDSHFISKIVIHPENPDIVYVSAVGSPYDNNPERGIFKTYRLELFYRR